MDDAVVDEEYDSLDEGCESISVVPLSSLSAPVETVSSGMLVVLGESAANVVGVAVVEETGGVGISLSRVT